jgi:hypothetical protein
VIGTSPAGRVSKGTHRASRLERAVHLRRPDVQNDSLAAAQAALQRVHLASTVDRVGSNSPVGTVLAPSRSRAPSWPQTKTVAIQVAEGLPLPDFVGENVQAAQQWAQQHGVTLNSSRTITASSRRHVTGQQPARGRDLSAGRDRGGQRLHRSPEVNVPDVGPVACSRRPRSSCSRRASRSR